MKIQLYRTCSVSKTLIFLVLISLQFTNLVSYMKQSFVLVLTYAISIYKNLTFCNNRVERICTDQTNT